VTEAVAPWELNGEAVVALVRRGKPAGPLPQGIETVPGPTVVVGASYADSPVGPYAELAVGVPARLGVRVGFCFTTMVATSSDARVGGRLNWGFPKELGTLVWTSAGDTRQLRWDERSVVMRGRPAGPRVPVFVRLRALQRRADGPVVVPWRIRGRARWGTIELKMPDGDPLAALSGQHRGALISAARLVVDPARRPVGRSATLRAPLRAAEPALSWGSRQSHPGD